MHSKINYISVRNEVTCYRAGDKPTWKGMAAWFDEVASRATQGGAE